MSRIFAFFKELFHLSHSAKWLYEIWHWLSSGGPLALIASGSTLGGIVSTLLELGWTKGTLVVTALAVSIVFILALVHTFKQAFINSGTKAASTQIERVSRFVLHIGGANIFVPPSPPNSSSIVIGAEIENLGDPSIAKDWNLSVNIHDRVSVNAVFLPLSSTSALTLPNPDGSSTVIHSHDALEAKTENTPVVGKVRGQLWFTLPGIRKDQVVIADTRLTLSVKDKDGVAFSTVRTIGELAHEWSNEVQSSDWQPLHLAVEEMGKRIGDTMENRCFANVRNSLRQSALDGLIILRGKKEIDSNFPNMFSKVFTAIPKDYWVNAEIGFYATGENYLGHPHTMPESGGITIEKNRYADLQINMKEFSKL